MRTRTSRPNTFKLEHCTQRPGWGKLWRVLRCDPFTEECLLIASLLYAIVGRGLLFPRCLAGWLTGQNSYVDPLLMLNGMLVVGTTACSFTHCSNSKHASAGR